MPGLLAWPASQRVRRGIDWSEANHLLGDARVVLAEPLNALALGQKLGDLMHRNPCRSEYRISAHDFRSTVTNRSARRSCLTISRREARSTFKAPGLTIAARATGNELRIFEESWSERLHSPTRSDVHQPTETQMAARCVL